MAEGGVYSECHESSRRNTYGLGLMCVLDVESSG